jgi:hypothetical protein
MTELKLETVVLKGVHVASDIVASPRMVSILAGQRDQAVDLSTKRHLPLRQVTETDTGLRYNPPHGGNTAFRAGRLAGLAGAPRRCPASAGRSVSLRRTMPVPTSRALPWRTPTFIGTALRQVRQGDKRPMQPRSRKQAGPRVMQEWTQARLRGM